MMACAVSVSQAANLTWQNGDPLGGNFSDSSRWSSPLVPGVNDTVTFNGNPYPVDSEFTVVLTQNVTNQWLRAANGTFHMVLNLNGFSYETTSSDSGHTYIQGNDVTLELTGGAVTLPVFSVGRTAGTTGKLILAGSSTTLNASGVSYISNAGTGALEITGGAKMNTTAGLTVAHAAAGSGSVLIEGAGSALNTTGSLTVAIGGSGSGSLEIKAGGQLVTSGGGNIRFALTSGSTSTGLITGQNSRLEGAAISIGGADNSVGGAAQVYVTDSAAFVARGLLRVYQGGFLEVEDALVTSNHLTADTGSTLSLILDSPFAGDQAFIMVANNVTLGDVNLNLSLAEGVSYAANDMISLINYGGILTGQFAGYDDGDILNVGGVDFQLSYGSGAASSISLTVIPEPGTVVLIIGGVLALAVWGKRTYQGKGRVS